MALYVYSKTYGKKSIQEQLFSQEWKDLESFPVSFGVCVAFLSKKKKLPEAAMKAWKRCLLTEFRTSQPFVVSSSTVLCFSFLPFPSFIHQSHASCSFQKSFVILLAHNFSLFQSCFLLISLLLESVSDDVHCIQETEDTITLFTRLQVSCYLQNNGGRELADHCLWNSKIPSLLIAYTQSWDGLEEEDVSSDASHQENSQRPNRTGWWNNSELRHLSMHHSAVHDRS